MHPRLRADVQLLRGMDDHPLAYDPGTGRYHRLSRSAAAVLRLLDGTRSADEVATALATARRLDPDAARAEMLAFLTVLHRGGLLEGGGLLDGEARPEGGLPEGGGPEGGGPEGGGPEGGGPARGGGRRKRGGPREGAPPARRRARRSLLLPRFVVTRALPRLLEPVARPLRAGRRAALAFWCLFAAGAAGTLAGLGALAGMAAGPSAPRWSAATAAAAVLLLIQVCLHESGHALVCQVLRVPVRGAGFALLCWLIPVAYVDRTDAYRIRGRTGRVALAVSGPLVDGVAMGVAAAVALAGPAGPAQVARDLLVFQGFTLLLNANPLLPSDGYVAAEAALGLVDPRGRALTLLRCALLRRPLPPHLHGLRGAVRAGYLGYGLACAGYGVLILYLSAGALAGALLRLLP